MSNLTPHESRRDRPFVAVSNDARPGGATYEAYYGLTARPFALVPDARFYYQSRWHAPALEDLLNAVRRCEPVSVLTGGVGTGKTVLCRALIERLDRTTRRAFVPGGLTSRVDLLKILLVEFGAMPADDLASDQLRNASRTELRYRLTAHLDALGKSQTPAVAFVDDAQRLPVGIFEELRLLSDDERLQLVLIGQNDLRERLAGPELARLQQRVGVCATLEGLDRAGIEGYIAHRIRQAGGSPDRLTFSAAAIDVLYQASAGIPRVINRLCDRALYEGFLRRTATIEPSMLPCPAVAPQPTAPETAMVAAASTVVVVAEPLKPVPEPASVTVATPAASPAPIADLAPAAPPAPKLRVPMAEPVAPAPRGIEAERKTSEALAEWLGRIELQEAVLPLAGGESPLVIVDRRPPRRPGAILRITIGGRQRTRGSRGYSKTDRLIRRWKRRVFMAAALAIGVGGGLMLMSTLSDILAAMSAAGQ